METKKILKGLGILGVGAGIGYGLYQAYKHYKADQEAALEMAEAFIEEQEKKMEESEPIGEEEDVVKTTEQKAEEAWRTYINTEEYSNDRVISNKVYNITRGVDILRYDANSEDAYTQYMEMMASDYELDPDVHETVKRLFDYTIGFHNRRDMIIRENIIEDRTRFFGKDSKFILDVTMAEIFIFYADKLSDDIGMDIIEAMRILLGAVDLDVDTPEDRMEATVSDLTMHCFWNEDRYGLFGITEEQYDDLYDFPEVAVNSDKDISYDMEYSVFMEYYADELIEELE